MSESRILENEYLRVTIQDFGAELASIYDKEKKREVLWDAKKEIWARHAPILFPFIGELYGKSYVYEGTTYPMTAHGFARDSEFTFVSATDVQVVHQLVSTNQTYEKYPFYFELEVKHTLDHRSLLVEWTVKNKDDKELYFSIGAHPAFLVPEDEQKDYYLSFGAEEEMDYLRIHKERGTVLNQQIHSLTLTDHNYKIGEHLFDDGVLIFFDKQVNAVGLLTPDGEKYITIHCKDFPYVGVWTKKGAPFICLEPWYGRADNDEFTGELKDKAGIQKLLSKDEFHAVHSIEIH